MHMFSIYSKLKIKYWKVDDAREKVEWKNFLRQARENTGYRYNVGNRIGNNYIIGKTFTYVYTLIRR